MKSLKHILFTVFVCIILLSANTLNSQTINRMKDRFYIGVINAFTRYALSDTGNLNNYKDLKLNAMQNYCGHYDYDSTYDGGFFDKVDSYSSYINGQIRKWSNSGIGLDNSMLVEREKILRAGYGQRSTYRTQYTSNELINSSIRPGYGFLKRIKSSENDTWYQSNFGESVNAINCVQGDSSGYIVEKLYENREQVNFVNSPSEAINNRLFSDTKDTAYHYRWFVKPRMRIDSIYAKTHLLDTVVVIKIVNFQGDTIKRLPIQCINFIKYIATIPYYNGAYLENFYNFDGGDTVQSVLASALTKGVIANAKGMNINIDSSKVDYKIYWPGKVTVWLDYVRVDDEWAHYLFTDTYATEILNPLNKWWFHHRIKDEVDAFKNNPSLGYFYFDEAQYNNIECIGEVNRLVREYSGNQTQLIPLCWLDSFTDLGGQRNRPTRAAVLDTLYSVGAIKEILLPDLFSYFFWRKLPPNVTLPNKKLYPGTVAYEKAASNAAYCDELNNEDFDVLYLRYHKLCAKFCKDHNMTYAFDLQANSDEINYASNPPYYTWGLREPTNEEIKLSTFLGLAYGAKQIWYYAYYSAVWEKNSDYFYSWGLRDSFDTTKYDRRDSNYYLQNKWEDIKSNNVKLKIIGDKMYPPGQISKHFVWDETRTVNYTTGNLPYRYLQDISSYPRISGTNNFDTINQDQNKYWEIGFFNDPQNAHYKYMVVVNKRATPEIYLTGDSRKIKFNFSRNESGMSTFNNWELKDIATNEKVVFAFSNSNSILYPYEFAPGEGKVFRLAPVMETGGTLIADEEISGINYVCDSTVFNNGNNISFTQGVKVMFNPKGKIVFNGGSFNSGLIPQNTGLYTTEFCGNGNNWEGISFQGSSNIYVTNSVFKNIAYEPPEGENPTIQNCAISLINCNNFRIQSSSFYMDNKAGGIYYQYSDDSNPNWQNTYIASNRFLVTNSNNPIVTSFNTLSAIQMPLRIEGNFFDNSTGSSATAILVNGISGGSIKNNVIHKYPEGLIAMSSSVDLYNNTFYSNSIGSKSIQGLNSSNINISPSEPYYLGGYNRITTMNNESNNIYVSNSLVFLENGNNHFNISHYNESGIKPYHIYGTFPSSYEQYYPAGFNCFNIDSVNADPVVDVTAGGNPVEFYFYSYSCNAMLSGDFEVFTSPGIVNDTVAVKYLGAGGSEKGTGESKSEAQISPCKSLLDSINISLRKRHYPVAESQCKRMLTLYTDSTACFDALNKLYLASLSQDSAGIKMGALKAFYETVILNNQGKVNLINRCFYLIQKCKVALKQYSSALDGFQLIMQQNPYTYEGLSASWDYAATHLLDSIHGSSGAYSNIIEEKQLTVFDLTDRYDSTKFTKKQRNDISKTVNDVLESKRVTQTEKIIDLQKKSNEGNKEAAKELKVMKVLNETVKKKTPNTHIELAQIIQNDIKKVFGSKSENTKETPSILPITYALYQNYPNPFNPTTKIAYDIPRDAKVKLVIYDILGREMKTLVNNEFRSAGKYITEFNGSNLASGIYFARILVNEGKDFMAVKKMVLVK